jgi:glycosyltransferase involved in cell wall biosynthesis
MYSKKGPILSIFIPSFGDGGVERMLVNLSQGLTQRGIMVDFLMSRAAGPYIASLPSAVRIIELGTSHPLKILPPLVRYLRQERPEVLLSAKRCDKEALRARGLAGVATRVVLRTGTTVSRRVKGWNPIKKWRSLRRMRRLYPRADAIIAVSKGVAEDVAKITSIPLERIHVIPNPVVTPELRRLAEQSVDHPWFVKDSPPIILGAGGFRRQKDFPTLLRAFRQVRKERPARLVILGKGRGKTQLEALARKLGIEQDLDLPGFVTNPYAYMAHSDLFVLSSLWEGSPNVLTEALAVGTPVVSTDCESGPREILCDGRYGPLVPVGDAEALAAAILETLANPLDSMVLQSAAEPYTIEASTNRYLDALGLKENDRPYGDPHNREHVPTENPTGSGLDTSKTATSEP